MSDNAKHVVPTVTSTSTVSELVTFLRYSFQNSEFELVETILTNRENNFKVELEELRVQCDLLKGEQELMERRKALADLEKLRLEKDLEKSTSECTELTRKVERLCEDHGLLNDRLKSTEEKCKTVMEELSKAGEEKERIVGEFKKKVESLECEKGESKLACDELKERLKRLSAEQSVFCDRVKGTEEKCKRVMEELLRVLEEKARFVVELEKKIESLKLEKGESKLQCNELKMRLEQLSAERNALCDREEKLEERCSNLVEELSQADKGKERIVGEYERRIESLELERGEVKLECNEAKEFVERLIAELSVLRDQNNKMEVKCLDSKVSKVDVETARMVGELNEESKTLEESKNELKDKEKWFNEEEKMLIDLEKMAEEKCQRLEGELKKVKEEKELIEIKLKQETESSQLERDGKGDLEVKIKQLNHEHKVILDREKIGKDRCWLLEEELAKVTEGKKRIVDELNEKTKALKDQKSDLAGEVMAYEEWYKRHGQRIEAVEEEVAKVQGVNVAVIRKITKSGEDTVCQEAGTSATASGNKKLSSGNEILPSRGNLKVENGLIDLPLANGDSLGELSMDNSPIIGTYTDLGVLPTGKQLTASAVKSRRLIRPSGEVTGRLGSANVINLCDSDDEISSQGTASVLNTEKVKFGEKCIAPVNATKSGNLCLETQHNGRDHGERSHAYGGAKRKRSRSGIEDDDNFPVGKQKTKSIQQLMCDNQRSASGNSSRKCVPVAPTVAETPCSSTCIKKCDEILRTERNSQLSSTKPGLKGAGAFVDKHSYPGNHPNADFFVDKGGSGIQRGRESTWRNPVDMLSAFNEHPELCMNAVCALYRQQMLANKSAKTMSWSQSGGFNSLDILRGNAVAKYLINNNPDYKLSRSISEVRHKLPEMLEDCRKLATRNCQQLFKIYQEKLDPYFRI